MISSDLRTKRAAGGVQRAGAGFVMLMIFCTAVPGRAQKVVDRIAAVVDQQVITTSEIDQMETVRFFPRTTISEDDYRHKILESLIVQVLRLRDVQRFGALDVPKDSIEARLQEIEKRFASPEEFNAALAKAELTLDDLRTLVKRQLQVESYIQERFAPMVFVSNEEVQNYYKTTWSEQRRQRGLAVPPLADVREEIRTLLKSSSLQKEIDEWTTQLRARANVDIYTWRKL